MSKFVKFMIIFMVFKTATLDDYNELLNVLKTFFIRRHVQTVTTANTCWPFGKYTNRYDNIIYSITVQYNSLNNLCVEMNIIMRIYEICIFGFRRQ